MKTENIVYTHTYDPALEADFLANVPPRRRHELMLESHQQAKADRREAHKRGWNQTRRMPVMSLK